MNKMANRWLSFVEDDLKMAQLALAEKMYNQVCFHAQQAAEKALKAFIIASGEATPHTHKLVDLLLMIRDSQLEKMRPQLQRLDQFYLPTRYPDALPGTLPEGLPNERDAKTALETAQEVLKMVQDALQGGQG